MWFGKGFAAAQPERVLAGRRLFQKFWLIGLCISTFALAKPAQKPPPEPPIRFLTLRDDTTELDVIKIDLRRARLRLLWRKPTETAPGIPFSRLRAAFDWLDAQGEAPLAVMNAGIYGKDEKPLGLHVQDGVELHPLDRGQGGGNFYLAPNGVFHIGKSGAGIHETAAYAAFSEQAKVDLATQSGPLLLVDGEIHPRFQPDSQSAFVRNGVGIVNPWQIYLVISRSSINFYRFARFFRDRLGCRDALYLDGHISRLHAPSWGRRAEGVLGSSIGEGHFVGMLAVLPKKPASLKTTKKENQ